MTGVLEIWQKFDIFCQLFNKLKKGKISCFIEDRMPDKWPVKKKTPIEFLQIQFSAFKLKAGSISVEIFNKLKQLTLSENFYYNYRSYN